MVALTSKRKAISLTLLSIMVPLSLLSAFRLTGIIPEPPKPETILIDPVVWTYERPSRLVSIEEYIKNTYQTDQVSLEMGVTIDDYFEDGLVPPFNYEDGVSFRVTINIAGIQRSTASILVKFCPADSNGTIYVDKTFLIAYNTSVLSMKQLGTNTSEAAVTAKASSSSSGQDYESYWVWRTRAGWMLSNDPLSGLDITAYWVFNDENIEDHQLKVSLEVTYFEGTIYRKIILPIFLEVKVRGVNI